MTRTSTWRKLELIADTLGVLTAITALAVIGWYIAMATHLAPHVASGLFAS